MLFFVCLGIFASGVLGASLDTRRQVTASTCVQVVCAENYTPVCGSDGVTYSNLCLLQSAQCRLRALGRQLLFSHNGACTTSATASSVVSGIVVRNCDRICDEDLQFICASNGQVYSNLCYFQRAQCEAANNGTSLSIVMYGVETCPKPRAPNCSKYHVDTSDLAIELGTTLGSYRCPTTYTSQYVCTNDGRSFGSECLLCHYMHVNPSASKLQIAHDGVCNAVSVNLGWLQTLG